MSRWPGTWRVICDVCGFEYHSDQVKKRWDGLIVCNKDYELRHPQDFIKIRAERGAPPFVRAEPEDVFIPICTVQTKQGIAGLGVAGCMIAGYISGGTF